MAITGKTPTLDDLLKALQKPDNKLKSLANTSDTWARIGSRDKFDELGMEAGELTDFLREWVAENPYSAL